MIRYYFIVKADISQYLECWRRREACRLIRGINKVVHTGMARIARGNLGLDRKRLSTLILRHNGRTWRYHITTRTA